MQKAPKESGDNGLLVVSTGDQGLKVAWRTRRLLNGRPEEGFDERDRPAS
jgi:hypothetical protein